MQPSLQKFARAGIWPTPWNFLFAADGSSHLILHGIGGGDSWRALRLSVTGVPGTSRVDEMCGAVVHRDDAIAAEQPNEAELVDAAPGCAGAVAEDVVDAPAEGESLARPVTEERLSIKLELVPPLQRHVEQRPGV